MQHQTTEVAVSLNSGTPKYDWDILFARLRTLSSGQITVTRRLPRAGARLAQLCSDRPPPPALLPAPSPAWTGAVASSLLSLPLSLTPTVYSQVELQEVVTNGKSDHVSSCSKPSGIKMKIYLNTGLMWDYYLTSLTSLTMGTPDMLNLLVGRS